MVVSSSEFRKTDEAEESLLRSQKKLYSPEGIRAFKRRQRARQSSPPPSVEEAKTSSHHRRNEFRQDVEERTSPKDEEEKENTEKLKREFVKAMGW